MTLDSLSTSLPLISLKCCDEIQSPVLSYSDRTGGKEKDAVGVTSEKVCGCLVGVWFSGVAVVRFSHSL
jgi:hypothetical protein